MSVGKDKPLPYSRERGRGQIYKVNCPVVSRCKVSGIPGCGDCFIVIMV